MMSRHFRLSSELSGAIAKNQLSVLVSFFNQFVTDIYIYIYIHTQTNKQTNINRVLIVRILPVDLVRAWPDPGPGEPNQNLVKTWSGKIRPGLTWSVCITGTALRLTLSMAYLLHGRVCYREGKKNRRPVLRSSKFH